MTQPDPTHPDPTHPDPTHPDPTHPDPTGPDPTGPDPTGRWPGELESNQRWQPPVVFASIAAVGMSALLIRGAPPGWPAVVAVVLALLAGYLLVIWLRTRARMAVHDDTLTVRRWREVVTVRPGEVESVRHRMTGHGPDFVVRTRTGRVLVPASRMRRGHSAFFEWLLSGAGEQVLDKGSRRTLDVVRQRGLITR